MGFDELSDVAKDAYQGIKSSQSIGLKTTPRFLQVDKRIAEVTNEIEYMTKMLDSKKTYLKQLETVRKIVKPADEAKIQALISAGLL